jgi:hypothetical protein
MRVPPVPVILLVSRIQPIEVNIFPVTASEPNPVGLLLMIVPFVLIVVASVLISLNPIPPITLILVPVILIPVIEIALIYIPLVRIAPVLRNCRRRQTQPGRENYPRE